MLSTVLLHVIETMLPVHNAFYCSTNGKRCSKRVRNDLILNLYIEYFHTIDSSHIRALSALLREEKCLIQPHLIDPAILLFYFLAGKNRSLKFCLVCIRIIQADCLT